ncbi:MAG TPA: hypothetical protein VI300_00080, partial [Solirubrobacter sp.]
MRRAWLVLLPLLAAAATWVVLSAGAGASDDGPLTAQPMLGTAGTDTVLMGAAGTDAWAYTQLPGEAAPPAGVDLAPAAGTTPQLAFLRYSRGGAWRVVETPTDANGVTIRGPSPNRGSAR